MLYGKLIDKMPEILDKIPEILSKSGNLLGLFALLALVVASSGVILFIRAEKKDKNRAFFLIVLFFFGLVIAALLSGVVSGFTKGKEAIITQTQQNPSSVNPSLVKLSSDKIRELENYIELKGEKVTDESKTRVLEKALHTFLSSQEPTDPPNKCLDTQKPSVDIKTNKDIYSVLQDINVEFSIDCLGDKYSPWITIVQSSEPEGASSQQSKYISRTGTHSFSIEKPGDYEIRIYTDPGKVLIGRHSIKVEPITTN
jgi:hypothetical protein